MTNELPDDEPEPSDDEIWVMFFTGPQLGPGSPADDELECSGKEHGDEQV